MKKRILGVALATILLIMMIPFGGALSAEGEFTAWFGAQMDPVNGWELGEVAEVRFDLNEEATISIDFGEVVSFGDGNYIAIETNIPNSFTGIPFANPVLAQILSFTLDGEEVELDDVLINAEGKGAIDGSGLGMRLTLANKWNGDISSQPVDPTTLGEFENLEITFIIRGSYFAQFGAQMADPVNGWGLGDMAATGFVMGYPAVIEFEFDEPVSFGDGNYIAIETNLPNPFDDVMIFSDSDMAEILSFKLDDNEIEMGDVLINAEGMDAIDGSSTGLRLTLANKWNGDISEQPVDPAELGEFSKLRIEFIIRYVGEAPEPPPAELPTGDFAKSGNAWIGGTFLDEEGEFDWHEYSDQTVFFELGERVIAKIDLGSDKQTHGEASWGYISVVQTDIQDSELFYKAVIYDIRVDGASISFDPDNVSLGWDRGVRFGLTDGWSNSPVVSNPAVIGEFSVLEVEFALFAAVDDEDDGGVTETLPPPPPIERPQVDEPKSEGMQWWVWLIICGGVVAVGAVVAVLVMKKKA